MTSDPAPEGRGTARKSVARHIRGYIQSYGEGRTCADSTCETTLSRYNKASLCWKHAEQRELAKLRQR
jgi:hypothetical protein